MGVSCDITDCNLQQMIHVCVYSAIALLLSLVLFCALVLLCVSHLDKG